MKPNIGDIIRDGDDIYTVTNLIDLDGNETTDAEFAVSLVAKGEDGWYAFAIDQLGHEVRH